MSERVRRGVFVTGTDTSVGKTVVSAWLVRRLEAAYWKPVQAGLDGETDGEAVVRLSGIPGTQVHPSPYRLRTPMSPHDAAERDGIEIDVDAFRLPETTRPLVVEGAGGVLVPLRHPFTMVDLMQRLGLPVVLVARTRLGTINHTLLSLACLREHELAVAGVIFSGPPHPDNLRAVEQFGEVRVLATIPWLDPLDATSLAAAAPEADLGALMRS